MVRILAIFTFSILLTSCAHYPDVRPSDKGLHKVSFLTDYKDQGFKEGFGQAKDFCDDVYEKRAIHVKDKSKYVGTMDEETYNKSKTASKVVSAIGGAGTILGGKKERKAGAVTAVGGGIADGAIGQGYRYTMWFKCK